VRAPPGRPRRGSAGVDDDLGRGQGACADAVPQQVEPGHGVAARRQGGDRAGRQAQPGRGRGRGAEQDRAGGEEEDGAAHDRACQPRPEAAVEVDGPRQDGEAEAEPVAQQARDGQPACTAAAEQ